MCSGQNVNLCGREVGGGEQKRKLDLEVRSGDHPEHCRWRQDASNNLSRESMNTHTTCFTISSAIPRRALHSAQQAFARSQGLFQRCTDKQNSQCVYSVGTETCIWVCYMCMKLQNSCQLHLKWLSGLEDSLHAPCLYNMEHTLCSRLHKNLWSYTHFKQLLLPSSARLMFTFAAKINVDNIYRVTSWKL